MSEPNSPIPTSTLEYYQAMPVPQRRPLRQRYWLHMLLLAATCFTTLVMGARMQYNFEHNRPALSVADESIPYFPASWAWKHPARFWGGWPFAATVMLFFLSHEMGHYLYCRYYGIRATLPFFIPAPTPIGTMGAVILIRSRIRSRAALFDVGIAGPIAGFVVAFLALLISFGWSKPAIYGIGPADLPIGFPLIFHVVRHMPAGLRPENATAGLSLGRILFHPAAIGAWVGMYATALNLLPSGQLDGGHIVYALWPRAHRAISWATAAGLVYLGRFNYGWWFWGAVVIVMNILGYRQRQAPEYPLLPPSRWFFGFVALMILVLTFTVSPFQAN
ncbi:MAG TPA: site-2 protease family protein [Candidatus Sulfotelmatobacter sp.]|nr:site-2 protease family protein [Candidatus Sulfotelmatobacter sp.]